MLPISAFPKKFSILLLLALALPYALGQVVGASIGGIVADSTGGILNGATVIVRNIDTGTVRNLISDNEGRYAAPSVAAGTYSITVQKGGFSTLEKTGIQLTVGQSLTLNLTLTVGEVHRRLGSKRFPKL